MDLEAVPPALGERLGTEATAGLLAFMDRAGHEWRTDVMAASAERFEYRLVQEVSGLRVQIALVESSIRQDMTEMEAGLRQDMAAQSAAIRQEMAQQSATFREEMAQQGATIRGELAGHVGVLRQEIANTRVEIIKWCFLFWIGQVITLTGIMAVMLRLYRP